MAKFYVYGHFDSKGQCRYIGKGGKDRAWSFSQRSKLWKAYFGDTVPDVKILETCGTEEDAFEKERYHISRYLEKGHELLNVVSDGDRGTWSKTEVVQRHIADIRGSENHWTYGKERPQETRDKIKSTKAANPQEPYWLGKKRDPETVEKMAAARRGKPGPWAGKTRPAFTQEHKDNISAGNMGKKHSEETRAKISAANKGKIGNRNGVITSEATKIKMAAARKKAWDSGKYVRKVKPVRCLDTGERFESMSEAAGYSKAALDGIGACCNGRNKTYKGERWAFA